MAFITASYYDTGSYINGTVDSFSSDPSLTYFYSASVMSQVSGSYMSNIVENFYYSNIGQTYIQNGPLLIPASSSHGPRPAKL